MGYRWFVMRTESRAEYLAVDALDRDGFQTYFPQIKAIHPRVGHSSTPLFPGYLFLRLDPEGNGWPIFRPSHKILGYVRTGDEIPSLPDSVVNDLIRRVLSINDKGESPIPFQEGDLVEVITPSYKTIAEVLESGKSRKGNIKVLLEFMGRLIRADVPWQQVQPATHVDRYPNNGLSNVGNRLPRRTRGKGRFVRNATSLTGGSPLA